MPACRRQLAPLGARAARCAERTLRISEPDNRRARCYRDRGCLCSTLVSGKMRCSRTRPLPTLVMNLEVKKTLPDEGAEWLAVRLTSKQIENGRFDLDISARDMSGELVALSHHVAMIVEMERNTRKSTLPKAAL
ncbi:hypothetical protein F4779DRAFT_617039 [Xylariaceae sp. FL0662B]|nr:hypothetical protein F4779DRAFT_617039 [Xylariaceae sp. FL0662B]